MPIKPTGRIGPFRVTGGPDGPTGEWAKIQFPTQKEEIEQFVLDLFVTEMRRGGATILKATKNAENNFDFTLELPGGKVFLDLMEIIYRDVQGLPYEGENIRIESYKYAEQIRDAVMAKSENYGRAGTQPIHLLTYITHWRFHAHEVVIRLVQYMLQEYRPIMENVFFLSPLDDKSASLRVLYPSANPLEGHDPNSFKDDWYLTLNPAKTELIVEKRQSPEQTMPSADPPAQIDDVRRISRCWVEEDGLNVVIEVELTNGKAFGLRLPYDQLDFTTQALLQNAVAAHQRQVERGIVPPSQNYVDDPLRVESFKVMRANDSSHLLVQCSGRGREGPVGMGSFAVGEGLARALGKQLLESADLMAKSQFDAPK
jgi:hypothetical protein